MAELLTYRVYRLDMLDKVRAGDWIEAPDDEEAKRLAAELCGPEFPSVEVRQGRRMVGTVHRKDPGA